jgi:hypothetical protein
MKSVVKPLAEITRSEWVAFNWIEITEYGDKDRKFIRGYFTTPPEAVAKGEEWDIWFNSAHHFYQELKQERENKDASMPGM